jgi:GTP-binding protein Era
MKTTESSEIEGSVTRAGYVALVGLPNVGKSSLLNALIGEKLSIVTPRAQTTRDRVMGIYTTDAGQIIFVDTPGLLQPKYLLQHGMLTAAYSAVADADSDLHLLDGSRPEQSIPDEEAVDLLREREGPLFIAINKADVATPEALSSLRSWALEQFGIEPHLISALVGEGVPQLRDTLLASMPVSPYLYPPDDLAVQPVRFFAAELIRETLFEECREEVPYSVAVGIEEFRDSTDPILIRAVLYLERESQKAIVIGRGGETIKKIGQRSRAKIEEFIGSRIFLDLWVKTLPRWRKSQSALRQLGYTLPTERKGSNH